MSQPQSLHSIITETKTEADLLNISPKKWLVPTDSNRTSQAVGRLIHDFGVNPAQLMAKFNPDMQVRYARDAERCHFGTAPTLAEVSQAYGRNSAESWMEIQLFNLSKFAGCKEKLTPAQITETAIMIFDGYPHYKLTEFMLFFQRFKRCEYGKFYGAVDPMVILQALSTFDEERSRAIAQREKSERIAQKETDDQEYQTLRKRYGQRVPDAWTTKAPLSFLQYRLMGFDAMNDEQLAREIDEIHNGKMMPKEVEQILSLVEQSFES